MTARRRSAHRKQMEGSGIHGGNKRQQDLPGRDSCLESGSGPSPTGGTSKSRGSLPVAVVLEIIAREYSGDAREEALCRVALRVAEESGQIESYRARWDEEESAPAGIRSSLLFDRNQCLELINYYKSSGRMEKLQQEKEKLAQIEGRLLLGGGSPTRITNEDLNKLEEFIKESGF
ncbi:hypothetical protein Psfp_02392 [Pelotomaculum sp. FP]|uniref:hypothetical protein n=1 Tax=Pelotomaculum sp. FP TaxID=261474 RepID=UPI00106694C2|nr:hypothetical protein [Pelotomaculum sp. FP]TEB15073.1 hypothetical protein Psfp_02392 [Pelotomaculum sp. FP]